MQSRFLIAIGSGLVSGLLFIAAASGSVVGLMGLAFLTPLPITIAGFAWGWPAAAIGAVVAFGFLTVIGSVFAGLFHLLLFGLPVTLAIFYVLLNRPYTTPNGRDVVEWYPIGWVLFGVGLASGIVATVALFAVGNSPAELEAHVKRVTEQMMSADLPWPGGEKPSGDDLEKLNQYLVASFPGAIAMSWMWVTLFNRWIGAKIARAAGLIERPWPNVSLTALPRWGGLALAGAMLLSFAGGYPGLVACGFATGLFLCYLLVGLAIVHNVTWQSAFRPLILVAVYLFLIFFNPLSSLAIATLALVEPFLKMRNPYNGGLISKDGPPDEPEG